jgi:hypothetical protein
MGDNRMNRSISGCLALLLGLPLLSPDDVARAATETVLYSFCSQQNCTDGEYPDGLVDVDGWA